MRTCCRARRPGASRCATRPRSRRRGGRSRDVEVAAELAVDAHQQIAVERGGHAERIVVGEQQLVLRLHEIGAEQQRVAGGRAPHGSRAGSALAPGRIEVADVRAEKQHQRAPGRCAVADAAAAQACSIRRLVRRRRCTPAIRSTRVAAAAERAGRDVDEVDVNGAGLGRAAARAASRSFSPLPGRAPRCVEQPAQAPEDVGAVRAQQPLLGARDAGTTAAGRSRRRAPSRARRRDSATAAAAACSVR